MTSNSILQLLLFVAVGLLVSRLAPSIIRKLLKKTVSSLPEDLQQTVRSLSFTPIGILLLCSIWYIGLEWVEMKEKWHDFFLQPLWLLLGYALISIGFQLMDFMEVYIVRLKSSNKSIILHQSIITYLKRALKILIVILAVLLVLQNVGLNVTSLLASLGIGGIALALGAKETFGNIFGGITVIFDKPFDIGDWIVCDKIEGTVEDIGIRSTRVKTFYDSLITIPNSIIANHVIDNVGQRKSRRTRFTLDLTYDTSPEEMEAFVEGVKNIILSNPSTKKDYFQVYFNGFGPSSLQVFINFFLKVQSWDEELLQKQNVLLEILRLSKKLNISFAFPTQTVDIPSFPGQPEKNSTPFSPQDLKTKAAEFAPQGTSSKPEGLGIFTPPKNSN